MPSADSCSNSDLDCGSAVKYTLQCEYPERVDFGPDKFGAFFGDVELGRIVQEEHGGGPVPCTSTAPTPQYQQLTPTSHFTPTGSLYAGSASTSDHSSSSQFERPSFQYDRSSSYIAEHASFVNEYSELNEDPDLRRFNGGRSRAGSETQYRPPPDYVRISAVLLIFSPPCASIALYWALKAKKHMKRGQNRQAWQLSNKAFYCLLLGLFCFLVVLISWSIASLVIQFRNNHMHSKLTYNNTVPHNKIQDDNEFKKRLNSSKEVRKEQPDLSKGESLNNIIPSSSPSPELNQSAQFRKRLLRPKETKGRRQDQPRVVPSSNPLNIENGPPALGQFITNMPPARDTRTSRGEGMSKDNRPPPDGSKSRNGMAFYFPDVDSDNTGEDNPGEENTGAIQDSNTEIFAEHVPIVTKVLPSAPQSTRIPTTTITTRISELSDFDVFFNNRKQLPERTTTIDPRFLKGVPVDPEQTASRTPRQMRHRRNVRQRPRGRRKHPES